MTRPAHCEWCPFPGCDSCAYKGGETVTAQRDSGAQAGKIRSVAGTTASPEVRQYDGALTAGTSPVDLTEGGKPMAANDVTPEHPLDVL